MPKKTQVNLARLKEAMNVKKWGISELAKYSGVHYDTVYSIVKGRRKNTTMVILTSLASALSTTPDYLLGEGEGTPPASRLPALIQQLADIAGNLSEVRQEELVRIAVALQRLEQEQQTTIAPMLASLMQLHEELVEQGVDPGTLDLLRSLIPPPRKLSGGHMPGRIGQHPYEPAQ